MRADSDLFELASLALACRDIETLLRTFAARAGTALAAEAVLVWVYDQVVEGLVCHERWCEPTTGLKPAASANGIKTGPVQEVFHSRSPRQLSAQEIAAAPLLHLEETHRAQARCALYLPLADATGAGGVVEILIKRVGPVPEQNVHFWSEAARLAYQVMANLEALKRQQQEQFAAVERLTALYDLGRTFTSTLELDALLPVVAQKIREVLQAEVCNIWLLDSRSNRLRLVQKFGEDPTSEDGAEVSAQEGVLAQILQHGHPKLLANPGTEDGLEKRRQAVGTFQIRSWMGAPLINNAEAFGVVEIINRVDGFSYTEDDLFFHSSISEQAAVALHNAQLLESERKAVALDELLRISKEITSTLNLNHVLATVVNQTRTIIPFDRSMIGYFDRGRLVIGAVSGEEEVAMTPEMEDLRTGMEWTARQAQTVTADFYDDGWHSEPQEAREKLIPFLEAYGYKGCCAVPLSDEHGAVGAIMLLSATAGFLTTSQREVLTILANQTTSAIKNAQLYQQLPLGSVLQGLMERKQRLRFAMREGRWVRHLKRAAAVAALLFLIPWPMRVPCNATVVPAERRIVSTIEGGVVERVFVREGDLVRPGDLLAQVNDGEDRVRLAQAKEALESARRELGEGEFRNDPSAAGQARMRADLHLAEVQFEQKRLGDARIQAPIAGIVVTPKVEEKVGTMLQPGEGFAEIVGQERMAAELSVEERELSLVRAGRPVTLKLNAFPTRSFRGTIERIGAQSRSDSGEQYFIVRSVFDNPEGIVRDGMVGRARIRAGGGWFQSGWYPVGYVMLRAPLRWLWTRAWALMP